MTTVAAKIVAVEAHADTASREPRPKKRTLLHRHLLRIGEIVGSEGLKSFLWVPGSRVAEIASSILGWTQERGPNWNAGRPDARRILTRPRGSRAAETVAMALGCTVREMTVGGDDSFLIVNDVAVLDTTPLATDGGRPEYIEDAVVGRVYLSLFEEMAARAALAPYGSDGPALSGFFATGVADMVPDNRQT